MLRKPSLDQSPQRRKSDSANATTSPNSSEKAKLFNTRRPSGGEWHSSGVGFDNGRDLHGETSAAGASQPAGKGEIERGTDRDRDQMSRERQRDRNSQAEAIKLREWVAETLRNSVPPSHADAEDQEQQSAIRQTPSKKPVQLPTNYHDPSGADSPTSTQASASTSIPSSTIQDSPHNALKSSSHPRSRTLEKRRIDPSYEEPSELGLNLRTRPTSMHAINEYSHQELPSTSNAVSTPSSPSRNIFQGGLKAFNSSSNGASRSAERRSEEKEKEQDVCVTSDAGIKKKRVQINEDLTTTIDGESTQPVSSVDSTVKPDSPAYQQSQHETSRTSTSSPQSNLDELSATRVGLGVGIGALGASSDVNDLLMQGLDSRRGSLAEGLPSPALGFNGQLTHSRNASTASGSNPATPSLHRISSNASFGTRDERAQSMGMAPRLSKSTLLDLGRLEGLTPDARDNPYLNPLENPLNYSSQDQVFGENTSFSSGSRVALASVGSTPTSSVVSAGLEMGLGMNLATSALFNALPGTNATSRAINSLAEPRYSYQQSVSMAQNLDSQITRAGSPSSRDSNSFRPRVSVTTRELERQGRSSLVQTATSRHASPSSSISASQAPIGVQASATIYSPIVGGVNAARLPSFSSRANLSEQGPEDEPPLSAIDRAETELARRRTTGSNNEIGWQAGKNRAAAHAAKEAAKPRLRSGTADSFPTSSRGLSMGITPLSPALESTSPTLESQRRGSAASSNARDSPYSYSSNAPHHQATSALDQHSSFDSKASPYHTGPSSASESNASITTGSISTSAWYSSNVRSGESNSTQAGTPSLGERALLSPEANPQLEEQSEFPLNSHSSSNHASHQPHLTHGGSGGRQSTALPKRAAGATSSDRVRFGGERPPPKGITPPAAGMAGIGNAAGVASSGINSGGGLVLTLPHLAAPPQGAQMGSHFGPGVRAKVSEVLSHLIDTIPIDLDLNSTSKERAVDDEDDVQTTTISIAEYGALNSRSMQLMQSIISQFSQRINSNSSSSGNMDNSRRERETLLRRNGPSSSGLGRKVSAKTNLAQSYFGGDANVGRARASSIQKSSALEDVPSRISFCITHEDSSIADFRALTQLLDTHPESYLSPHFQASHIPSLQNHIFPSFVARPFASRIAPPKTFHLGFSLMDLHWSHTPRNTAVSLATTAHAELTAFLTARSNEFKKGGIFLMAFIARSEEKTGGDSTSTSHSNSNGGKMACSSTPASPLLSQAPSPSTAGSSRPPMHARSSSTPYEFSRAHPPHSSASSPGAAASHSHSSSGQGRRDIWTTLTNSLAPCLQRLVSCGMLKSELARALLILPMHPRTPSQTKVVLKGLRHVWKVEWSCGLGEGEEVDSTTEDHQEEELQDDGSGVGSSRRASRESEEIGGSGTSNLCDGVGQGLKPGKGELKSEPAPLRLAHPAWKALQAGTLSVSINGVSSPFVSRSI